MKSPPQSFEQRVRETLELCAQKLRLYCERDAAYVGGLEHSFLQERITEALSLLAADESALTAAYMKERRKGQMEAYANAIIECYKSEPREEGFGGRTCMEVHDAISALRMKVFYDFSAAEALTKRTWPPSALQDFVETVDECARSRDDILQGLRRARAEVLSVAHFDADACAVIDASFDKAERNLIADSASPPASPGGWDEAAHKIADTVDGYDIGSEHGFVRCDRCGEQIDLGNCDGFEELRAGVSAYRALKKPAGQENLLPHQDG